jgi:hypothetical protein
MLFLEMVWLMVRALWGSTITFCLSASFELLALWCTFDLLLNSAMWHNSTQAQPPVPAPNLRSRGLMLSVSFMSADLNAVKRFTCRKLKKKKQSKRTHLDLDITKSCMVLVCIFCHEHALFLKTEKTFFNVI